MFDICMLGVRCSSIMFAVCCVSCGVWCVPCVCRCTMYVVRFVLLFGVALCMSHDVCYEWCVVDCMLCMA